MMKKLYFTLAFLCLSQGSMQARLSDSQIQQAKGLVEDGYKLVESNGITYLTKLRDKKKSLDIVSMFGDNNGHQTLRWRGPNKKRNLRNFVINSQKAFQTLVYEISDQQRTQKLVENILNAVNKIADEKVSDKVRGADVVKAIKKGNLAKAIHFICSGVVVTNRQRENIVSLLKEQGALNAFSIALDKARIDYAPAFFHEESQSLFNPFFNSLFFNFPF